MIRHETGDLLASDIRVIAHGCNCLGAMGAGIAAQIRKRWPEVFDAYRQLYIREGLELGTIQTVRTHDDRIIVNCMTQQDVGTDSRKVDYDAVRSCMRSLNQMATYWGATEIGMPRIGAGLAGGDWDIIAKIIDEEATNFTAVVYTL